MKPVKNLAEKYQQRAEARIKAKKEAEELEKKIMQDFLDNNPKPKRGDVECSHGNKIEVLEPTQVEGKWQWGITKYKCEKCESLNSSLKVSKIPLRYAQNQSEYKYIPNILHGESLLFLGGVGTGKTHEICSLIKAYVEKTGRPIKFRTATEVARLIKDSITSASYSQIYEDLVNNEVLVIDDFGSEMKSDFMKEFFYSLVNDRYNNMKPVIISTNLTTEELIERYSQRTISRLTEMSKVVKLQGKDRRVKNEK